MTPENRVGFMKKQITHLSSHQTSKVFAMCYAAFCALFMLLILLAVAILHPEKFSQNNPDLLNLLTTVVFAPLASGLFGYLFSRVVCALYNRIAQQFGGIEFTVSEVNDD